MARYALIKNNIVENVIEAGPDFLPILQSQGWDDIIESSTASPGWSYDSTTGTFSPPVDTKTYLTITLDKTVAQIGELITATAEVRDGQGTLVDINGTYHVRIVNPIGQTARLLKVTFTGGQAQTQFSVNEADIYTLDMSTIRPKPSAILSSDVELIVEE